MAKTVLHATRELAWPAGRGARKQPVCLPVSVSRGTYLLQYCTVLRCAVDFFPLPLPLLFISHQHTRWMQVHRVDHPTVCCDHRGERPASRPNPCTRHRVSHAEMCEGPSASKGRRERNDDAVLQTHHGIQQVTHPALHDSHDEMRVPNTSTGVPLFVRSSYQPVRKSFKCTPFSRASHQPSHVPPAVTRGANLKRKNKKATTT